ncbi:hypothetical protein QJS04_geneDACA017301 [Acorus gramineus]|uniref:Uncharacterized protein n=1 Tax=Acorus gramineus TaxID=55184 RepID=A0AAV9BD71_ACOGR|nr:hypothetical protein QJS04_geneDACA017301 [Acorus gramineus]
MAIEETVIIKLQAGESPDNIFSEGVRCRNLEEAAFARRLERLPPELQWEMGCHLAYNNSHTFTSD